MTLWLYVSKNHSSIKISQNNATKFTQKYYAVILTFIHCFSSNSQRSGNLTESRAIGQHFQVSSCQLPMIDVLKSSPVQIGGIEMTSHANKSLLNLK